MFYLKAMYLIHAHASFIFFHVLLIDFAEKRFLHKIKMCLLKNVVNNFNSTIHY